MGDPVAVLGLGRTSPTVLFDGDPGFFYPGQAVFRIRYALGKGGLAVQLRISPKALLLWRIYLTAALVVMCALSVVLIKLIGALGVLFPLLLLPVMVWTYQYYLPALWRSHQYIFEDGQIVVKRGVYQRTVRTVLTEAVLMRETRRTPLEIVLGMTTVVLHVAGGRIVLNQLPYEDAVHLVEQWESQVKS